MKRSITWLLVPVALGILVAVLAVVIPAQASQPIQATDTSDHHPRPSDDDEARGLVESFPEELVGSWTVDGVNYVATQDTYFSDEEGPFAVGACVTVRFNPDTYIAYAIKTAEAGHCGDDDDDDDELHFIGLIEQVPGTYTDTLLHHDPVPGISGTWVISGVEFISTFDTELKTRNGPLEVGACANVEYRVVDGVNMAEEIRTEKMYRCYTPDSFNQAYGYVVTFPDNMVGAWVISDTAGVSMSFMTTPNTKIHVRHQYPLEVGACIRVKYFFDEGANYATSVKTSNPRHCEGFFFDYQPPSKIYALVDSAPPTGTMTGTWVLAGVSFTATEETRIEEEEGPLGVGVCAEAKYDATNGAMLMRKLESEEDHDCQAGDGSPRFKLFGVVELMPDGVYTGTWQVSGVSFTVTPTTTLESRHGDFAIGAYVKVYFTYDAASGERTAQLVKTHVAPGFGRWHHRGRFEGWAHDFSGDRIILDGQSYMADPDIDVADGLKEGDMVWINGYQETDGLYITQVSLDQSTYLPLIQR